MQTAPTPASEAAPQRKQEPFSPDLLGGVQVLDVVDVDVAEEDEALDVIGVVLDQLVEEGRRLQGPHVVRQEQRQVEQRRPEVLLQLDGLRGEQGRRQNSDRRRKIRKGKKGKKEKEKTGNALAKIKYSRLRNCNKKKKSSKIIVCIYYQQ